jgi:thiamine biosynthesis lipoprotein
MVAERTRADVRLEKVAHGWRGHFVAMASPCEVLMRQVPQARAQQVADAVAAEAWRIERAFSRYRDDNIVAAINCAKGSWVAIDAETDRLLDYADTCWQLSDGMFDITSGILRRVWRFDGSDNVPSAEAVAPYLGLIGWAHVRRRLGEVRCKPGMELDFGGIGKEYAVDRALQIARTFIDSPVLVNFGGDIAAWCGTAEPWQVGLEGLADGSLAGCFALANGALATSGDSRRFLLRDGVRYSHVLNPKTGRPIDDAPHSVTVTAQHCIQAGMLATLALLHGAEAEVFLRGQDARYWCLWGEREHAAAIGRR